MRMLRLLAAFGAAMVFSTVAMAQELIVYPNKGQSAQQQEQDQFQCYSWAKGQSGFDPMAPPTATAPPPQQGAPKGGVASGAVKGGLLGLGVGAIAGDSKKGAAIGALSGGAFGGMRRNQQRKQESHAQQQWERQQANQYTQARSSYNRAFAACMEGRGYTVR